jgi:DNA-binding NtrC family response regulator
MAHVLVVEDDPSAPASLAALLRTDGHSVYQESDIASAIRTLSSCPVDVVVSDIRIDSRPDGLQLLGHIRREAPGIPVVLFTALGDFSEAVNALKRGAHDYLVAPIDPDRLRRVVKAAAAELRSAQESQHRPIRMQRIVPFDVVVSHDATKAVFARARQLAQSDLALLITGESGTGKELLAGTIYRHSRRRMGALVPLNCGAFPESLVESELFGHRKGAFTGAVSDKPGLVEVADRGTLFLDEIGDMPPYVQVSLLRFLDSGEFRRVGDTTIRYADVRVIAATNRDLAHDVDTGRFRQDLFYRIGAISLHLPPLRERREEIPALARHYLEHTCSRLGLEIRGFTDEALSRLLTYRWPGNVRELKGVIECAAVMADSDVITRVMLPDGHEDASGVSIGALPADEETERRRVEETLQNCRFNHRRAAQILGISRTTLWRKLRRHSTQP